MYAFREKMVDALRKDLVGPSGGMDEMIDEAPLSRYIVGALWPVQDDDDTISEQGEKADPTGAEADAEADEGSPVAESRMRFPSSVGMTFSVRASAGLVSVIPRGARYEDTSDPGSDETRWQRHPLPEVPMVVDLREAGVKRPEVADGLQLYTFVRPERDGVVTVTVALKNTRESIKGELRDSSSWFQVGLTVRAESDDIVDRSVAKNIGADADLDTAALMYRDSHSFAIGHGCAADWDRVPGARDVSEVRTEFIPTHEVHRAKPGAVEGVDLRMKTLANGAVGEITANLTALTSRYRDWIDALEGDVHSGAAHVDGGLRDVAARHFRDMRRAADRVDVGIRLLDSDADALRAFRLANRAMQLQRARQDWVRGGAEGTVGDGHDAQWRPFQIAYVLLNLPGINDPKHADRDVADLLWFPTGGGKTEAYLGLVAFVILLRRIRDSSALGVAVIMRYTLRLLTIQQFERAAMLMCSLETVREADPKLGSRPFSIGLWVGSGATPNSLREARTSLTKLANGQDLQEKNPVQLTQCPWCGTAMNDGQYSVERRPHEHLRIACGTPSCDFRNGLPVHVIDEDVYRARPELILGTVDKFAMMAWNENVGKLFARDGIGSAPELIIQDELHLISGPLGSMVGLYETAVDAACSVPSLSDERGRARPKVIASTATIRRAEEQVKAVFDRTANLFPPPGIDPDRSFFAEPSDRNELGTRQYVGVMASGTSHATLLVRVYAALLQAAADIDGEDAVRDPYWTLLGYFNSLRVLGSAYLQVEGDVRERLGVVARRSGSTKRELKTINELTSRVPSSEIPERLKALETAVGGTQSPNDVVLATNMISVGVDIDRLGLMAVMGQPQASAEYIQATSRVGRKHPGLVVTIFNSARSRDRSHYESFRPFHQSLYRAVEATSATPFAARARDRGLHGVLIAATRMLVKGMAADDAAHFASERWDDLVVIDELVTARVARVAPDEAEATESEIGRLREIWADAGDDQPNLKYKNKNFDAALMVRPEDALVNEDIDYSVHEPPWPTLQSMRDVDAESSLHHMSLRRKK
ncbi:helicase [Tsukamurella tyrosinosolvens]|uniref:Helicase conserved C-terminal domain-containing protein n=2 Tax=Tsukamurella tyrosinosolvens TaxID=57704 RepID=A0A1H4R7B5_TSUTY|nr:helicase-related protein [Tsukamurella tyrosinosolvens]KXO91640.1 helicase [Tsukamurella tyrosinosolvens]SEC27644.1 Helicase conserved C-terminal domain-containing protein [Tsukamurella tyrosinosolvens]